MVFEQLFKAQWLENRPTVSLFIGFGYTIISFLAAFLLFSQSPRLVGIATILLTVIITIPSVNSLFSYELEKHGKKKGKGFFRQYVHIVDFAIYYFMGVFAAFLLISLVTPALVFSERDMHPVVASEKGVVLPDNLPPPPIAIDFDAIFANNLYVLAISFLLSVFYGAGAFFLIVLNASIFVSALTEVLYLKIPAAGLLHTIGFTFCNTGTMLVYTLPELIAYLLAAVAGIVVSVAMVKEGFFGIFSKRFRSLLGSIVSVLMVALILLIVSAAIEVKVAGLFSSNVCSDKRFLLVSTAITVAVILLIVELIRRRRVVAYVLAELKRKMEK